MKSSLTDKELQEIHPEHTVEVIPPDYYRLKTENIKTIEDIALILEAVKFNFQEGHPFFEKLKERDLL